ncbi:MAG: 4'-phosphopantetheinyl transferase [Sphingobacteriales bacterium]
MNEIFSDHRGAYAQYFTEQVVGTEALSLREYKYIESAIEKRKTEFSTGRFCAKKALENIGLFEKEILVGTNREPLWPEGILGSISHCDNFTGAVVGCTDKIVSIGIDIENIGGIKSNVWDVIYTTSEQQFLTNTPTNKVDLFSTLIFSFKESLYKFQYPITGIYLDFKDVEITFERSEFSFNIINKSVDVKSLPFNDINTNWTILNGKVFTCCVLRQ